MNKSSELFPEEYTPAVYGIGGAAAGGLLGWFYDKWREKKNTEARIGIGALLGALGGTTYGQHVINESTNDKISRNSNAIHNMNPFGIINGISLGNNADINRINKALGELMREHGKSYWPY